MKYSISLCQGPLFPKGLIQLNLLSKHATKNKVSFMRTKITESFLNWKEDSSRTS